MSAARHIHPDQLRMFMPAKELIGLPPNRADFSMWEGKDARREGIEPSKENFWASRVKESDEGHRTGLRESIGAEGVAQPVVIHHSGEHPEGVMLAQGHHRVASATVANPEQLVPVKHYGPDYQFKEAVHEREYVKYGGLASLRSEPF